MHICEVRRVDTVKKLLGKARCHRPGVYSNVRLDRHDSTQFNLFLLTVSICYVCHSLCAAQTAAQAEVVRRDFFVPSDPGIQIFVREVRRHHLKKEGDPVVLIHGARPSGAAWFDVDVPRGSLAADIAVSGHAVYVPDMRGFGRSTKSPEMNEPPEKNPPSVRSPQAVRDIQAVVEWVSKEHHIQRVAILGWATGGHWAGYFATLRPDLVSHLILCNTLYGASTAWPLQKTLQDPNDPTRLNRSEDVAYRLASISTSGRTNAHA